MFAQLPVFFQLGFARLRVCVKRQKEVCADRVSSDGHWGTGSSAARDVGSSGAHDSRSGRRRRKVGFRRSGAHDIRNRSRRLKVGFQRNAVVTA